MKLREGLVHVSLETPSSAAKVRVEGNREEL